MALADLETPTRLDALLGVTRLVRADVPRPQLVAAVAAAIATSLDFATVVVNLRRPAEDDFAVAAVHGSEEARAALDGTTSSWADWAPLLDDAFAQAGSYLVPAGSVDWTGARAPTYVPARFPGPAGPDAWDPEDALFVPLADSSGALLGIVSVDEPRSGLRPAAEDLPLLAAFCAHLAAALELADLSSAHGARAEALERLARTSVATLGTLDLDDALAEACLAVAEGLGFRHVEVALEEGGRLVTRHAVGTDRRLDGLAPADLAAALASAPVLEGCQRLGPTPEKPADCLLTGLSDRHGRALGVLRAADPIETGLPLHERRRLLRTFANGVEACVSSAAHEAASAAQATLRRERDQARHAALHDPVTGLPNRTAALQHVAAELPGLVAAGGGLLALGVALDGYELITQSLGFAHGEDLLRAAGERLRRDGEPGRLTAHCGTCEFLLLVPCPDRSPEGLAAIAHGVEATLRRPFAVDGLELSVDGVVGYALLDDPGAEPADLLRRVDVARHHARVRGHAVAYDPAEDDARRTLTTLAALRGAVDRGELELHYQPVWDVADRRLSGLEALLRWRQDGALVPPAAFIGLAETSGLIAPIGDWVIDEACRQARAWADAGLEVPVVGVNVSPRQLGGDLAGTIAAALAEHGVRADRFCVEVTESAFDSGAEATVALLHELNAMGVRTAIDDFGSEYSSLNRIASLPVRMIKLDRGFVQGVPETASARRLLGGVLGVARALGVMTVVEGVERPEQLDLLPGFGADLVQGFLLARPEPPERIAARLRALAPA